MRQIFIGAFMLIFAVSAFSQQFINGKVLDEKGYPLTGATVVVIHTPLTATTDRSGSFRFDKLTEKSYTISVSFIGYAQKSVQAFAGKDIIINMEPKLVSINEVTVTSLRATDKSPVAYTNLSKETLSKTNLGQDIPYLLMQTPSFVASSDAGTGIGYTGFRIRGTDAARINVTINGIPYNDADEQGAYWVDLPDFTSSVESVQVQRGVGTSTNGAGAFGANINFQTENYAQKASGEVSISAGSFNTLKETVKASSGLINGHWAVDTRLSKVESDGYIDRGTVDMNSYFFQAGYYDEKTSVKFITFGGKEKTYHAWDGVDSYALPELAFHRTYNPCGYMGDDANGNPLYYKNQTDNYVQTHYHFLVTHIFSPELSFNAGLHYTRGDGYYEEYKGESSLKKYGLQAFTVGTETIKYSDLVRQKIMRNDFAGGVFSFNYQKDKLSAQLGGALNNYWGDHWGEVIWVKNYVGNLLSNSEYYRNTVSKWDGNVYLKANYELSTKLNVYADVQYRGVSYQLHGKNDKWDGSINGMQALDIDKKFNFFNPKAGLYYRPNINNDFFASIAVAHREPTRTNYTDGSAAIWPTSETLYDTELGYKFHNNVYSLGVNAYFMYYHNQLVLTGKINDIGEMLTDNIPVSYRSGIELMGSVKPFEWLRWDVTTTFSRNRVIDFVETVNVVDEYWSPTGESVSKTYHNSPIAFTPAVMGNSLLTFTKDNFEAAVQTIYVGKQYVDNTGSIDRRLPGYLLNNLRFSYTLPLKGIRSVGLSLMVNNLFNEMYISNAWSAPSISATPANPVYNENSPVNNYFGCYPQAGINFLAGITVKF